ncbi:MAG: hypothetical protein WAS94_00730 [Candidatus Saccharimonadales bacterium]
MLTAVEYPLGQYACKPPIVVPSEQALDFIKNYPEKLSDALVENWKELLSEAIQFADTAGCVVVRDFFNTTEQPNYEPVMNMLGNLAANLLPVDESNKIAIHVDRGEYIADPHIDTDASTIFIWHNGGYSVRPYLFSPKYAIKEGDTWCDESLNVKLTDPVKVPLRIGDLLVMSCHSTGSSEYPYTVGHCVDAS